MGKNPFKKGDTLIQIKHLDPDEDPTVIVVSIDMSKVRHVHKNATHSKTCNWRSFINAVDVDDVDVNIEIAILTEARKLKGEK